MASAEMDGDTLLPPSSLPLSQRLSQSVYHEAIYPDTH